jgi:hypothetical protein
MRRREFMALMGASITPIVDTVHPVIELTEAGELPYYRGFFERLRQLGIAEGQIFESSDIPVRDNQNVLTTWSRRWSTLSQTQSS